MFKRKFRTYVFPHCGNDSVGIRRNPLTLETEYQRLLSARSFSVHATLRSTLYTTRDIQMGIGWVQALLASGFEFLGSKCATQLSEIQAELQEYQYMLACSRR